MSKWSTYEDMRSIHRDKGGEDGQLRLYLPRKEFSDAVDSTFIEAASREFTNKMKNPSDEAVQGFMDHVHDVFGPQGISRLHGFFGGSSGSQGSKPAGSADVPACDGEPAGESNGEPDVEEEGPSRPPNRAPPRRMKRDSGRVELSDSDVLEADPPPVQKKRKWNFAESLGTLSSTAANKVTEHEKAVKQRLEAGTKLMLEHKKPPADMAGDNLAAKADRIALAMKIDAVERFQCISQLWLKEDPGQAEKSKEAGEEKPAIALAAEEERNEKDKKSKDDEETKETDKKSKVEEEENEERLQAAIADASMNHSIAHPHHLRSRLWLVKWVEALMQVKSQDEVNNAKIKWQRLEKAVGQLATSHKQALKSLEKHKPFGTSAKKRKRTAGEKGEGDEAAKVAKAAPGHVFFNLDQSKLLPVPVLECEAGLPSDFDFSQPASIGATELVDNYFKIPLVQQVMAGFGARYRKLNGYQDSGNVSLTFLTKQGKEEAEAFFYTLLKACPEPMDMKPVSAAYNSTTWLLGYKPQHVFDFAIAPNAASFFKLTFEGATEMWLVNVASLVKALTAAKVADAESLTKCGYKGVVHRLETMSQEDYDSWSSHGLEIFYFHAKKKTLVYVPCGWFITERVGAAQLNYAIRKSLFWDIPDAKTCYSFVKDLNDASGHAPGKQAAVLGMFA